MNVKTLMDDFARSIVEAVMAKHRVGPKDFYRSRLRHHVEARADAIRQLSAAGFPYTHIARLLKCSFSTAEYWCNAQIRKRRLELRKAAHHRAVAAKELRAA